MTSTPLGPTNSTARVTVQVRDINDQVPTFEKEKYEGEIQENSVATIPVTMESIFVWDYDEVTSSL